MKPTIPARKLVGAVVLTTGLALTVTATTPATAGPQVKNNNNSESLRTAVTPEGVREHLTAFQGIADANGGNRASGTAGYDRSRDYVVQRLRAAGYKPTVQRFDFAFFQERSPATLAQVSPDATAYDNPADFTIMTYSAPGDVTAEVVPVDTDLSPSATSTSGCEAADFAGFPAGSIALMQRGTCTFGQKVENADAAGASAAIISNRGTEGFTETVAGTLGGPAGIPAVGASSALAQDLADPAGTTVRLVTDTISEIRPTYNVFAETAGGNPDNVVMTGAHLDSVIVGPGINDNGSGSATILEVAEQMAKVKPKNKVRFAWWGAEELGLLGSEHYITDLKENNPGALEDIGLYLNFDMVGSPNYVRFVYDGDNSDFGPDEGGAIGPAGSAQIEKTFRDYFTSQDLASAETPFSGRSDYGPFIAEDIPAGGLFTGAEGVKTAEEAAIYGGQAGVAYDPCYHQECDTIANVSMQAIDEMSDAVAHSIITYARSTTSLGSPATAAPDARKAAPGARKAAPAARSELHPAHDHLSPR